MQRAYYKLLRSEMLFSAGDESVTSVNAAVKMSKLLQIASGAVYTDAGEVLEFDVSNRLNVVLEVVEESSHKVLIFVPFTHTIELLQNLLEKNNISCSVINGAVPMNKRSQIVQDFQTKPEPHVLIIQPQAASHGLTLTAANTIIWYAPISSVETYLQANARIDRPGQQNNMTIYNITGSDVETRLYKMLQTNVMNHQQIIDLYKQVIANNP
jgi:SNF2 family DNA or RNA helicase